MKDRINTYFATLIVLLAGAGAAYLIVHTANRGEGKAPPHSEASYSDLKDSILNTKL